MKQAEFLNLETKQVQWLDASLEHPNLVRVPEGAMRFSDGGFFKSEKVWFSRVSGSWCFCDGGWSGFDKNVIWQRPTPLRQKVNEAKQKTGLNERQLSHKIGREESYITKMFSDKRNPKPATIDKLIEDLDIVMNYDEFKRVIKKATVDNEINAMKTAYEQEIKLKIALLNQANQNTEMYRHKCEAQENLIKWMSGLIVMLLVLGFMMVTL